MVDVVIVGAGPVGLWTSILLRLYGFHVVILEKHSTYKRLHPINLHPSSLLLPGDLTGLAIEKHKLVMLQRLIKSKYHNTSELEQSLSAMAIHLGVTITKPKEIKDVTTQVLLKYPTARFIIGADGSHSVVRKQLFADALVKDEVLCQMAELRYELKPLNCKEEVEEDEDVISIGGSDEEEEESADANSLDFLNNYSVLKCLNHVCKEHVRGSQVSVRFLLENKDEWESLQEASFKRPLTFDEFEVLPRPLQVSMLRWMKAKELLKGERVDLSTVMISGVSLRAYHAKEVAKLLPHPSNPQKLYLTVLVGDAALGVPFFRALNVGLVCATRLAPLIADVVTNSSTNGLFRDYPQFVHFKANVEVAKAKAQARFFAMANGLVFFNSLWPWQIITLKRQVKETLMAIV